MVFQLCGIKKVAGLFGQMFVHMIMLFATMVLQVDNVKQILFIRKYKINCNYLKFIDLKRYFLRLSKAEIYKTQYIEFRPNFIAGHKVYFRIYR